MPSEPRVHEVMGRRVRVYDSWRVALRLAELLDDPYFGDGQKLQVALKITLPNPEGFCEAFGDETGEAFLALMKEAFCFDFDERAQKRVIDPVQDAARIRVTMRSAYGLGDEFQDLPFREVCEMVGMSPFESPMGQAIYYRTAKRPKKNKYNAEQVKAFDRLKRAYRLR